MLPTTVKADLTLWMNFFAWVRDGTNLNTITFQTPVIVMGADACDHSMGGLCQAWLHLEDRTFWRLLEKGKRSNHAELTQIAGFRHHLVDGTLPPFCPLPVLHVE